nr:hypothetical protein GCM10020093_115200 [Planobispora longispora]
MRGGPPGGSAASGRSRPPGDSHGEERTPARAQGRAAAAPPVRPVTPAPLQPAPVAEAPSAPPPVQLASPVEPEPRRAEEHPQVSIPRPTPEPAQPTSIVPRPADRKGPVIFEEQGEDLDVPDFLK